MKQLYLILCILLCSSNLLAQGIDPTLAAMIASYTQKAENQLKSQERAMLLETTGHVWIKDEVVGTTDLHEEFNNYLSSFRSIVSYAAQIYGFYYEIGRIIENMSSYSTQLSRNPGNALAVALSSNRNKLYREVILGSVEIVNDIRQVCLSEHKMTEKERIEIVFSIRPKLKAMNKKLQHLTKAVKYTTLSDIWTEIAGGSHESVDKLTITRECMNRWKRNGRKGF